LRRFLRRFMQVSLRWLRRYADLPAEPERIAAYLTSLGLEVEGVETVGGTSLTLDKIVVGHVLTCEQHPDADRLRCTTVDIGADEPLNIVCGAPNVATGQKVIVATVGSLVMDREGKTFSIKQSKIRGAASEGMICALDELGLGNDHSGIHLVDPELPVGLPAADILLQDTDTVFHIGLTPNRSDAMCHLGVVRDLAAAFKVRENAQLVLRQPDTSAFAVPATASHKIQIEINAADRCSRYFGVVIDQIKVCQSPTWLANLLRAAGVRPINNVVDATNFVMLELGQPLHAFDLGAIGGSGTVKVQTLPAKTAFTTLDGTEIELHEEDLMICNDRNEPMCIAGVYGGQSSGVSDQTTAIFLESALFNPISTRRSSRRHQFFTDAASRFEKGVDPQITRQALERCALLIAELAGGVVASQVASYVPNAVERTKVHFDWNAFNRFVGAEIPQEKVCEVLKSLDMTIESETAEALTLLIPTDKPDVTRPADVIEEILRVYGFDNVPMSGTIKFSMGQDRLPAADPALQATRLLNALGFHEAMSLSLADVRHFENDDAYPTESLVKIHNTANKNLDIMRPSMLHGLLDALSYNLNRKQHSVRLFEFGRIYHRLETGSYREDEKLAILLAGPRGETHWLQSQPGQTDYYDLSSVAQALLQKLGMPTLQTTTDLSHPHLSEALHFKLGQQLVGVIGKVSTSVAKRFDIKVGTYYAEFDWSILRKMSTQNKTKCTEITRFPVVERDLAIVLKKDTKFAELERVVRKAGQPLLRSVSLFDVFRDEARLGADAKSYALHFRFESLDRTLTDADLEAAMQRIIKSLEQQMQAVVRST
jgi:phenylalanyl-tRNA synthetase beta chain